MRRMRQILYLLCSIALMTSCEKPDDTQPIVNPTIQFRTDSGYTYQSDTISQGDTLKVGVLITRGTNAMHHFKVIANFDGNSALVTDSLPMGTDNFEFDKTIIARDQAGTEKWSFNIIENDGDVIKRSLTFTVE